MELELHLPLQGHRYKQDQVEKGVPSLPPPPSEEARPTWLGCSQEVQGRPLRRGEGEGHTGSAEAPSAPSKIGAKQAPGVGTLDATLGGTEQHHHLPASTSILNIIFTIAIIFLIIIFWP